MFDVLRSTFHPSSASPFLATCFYVYSDDVYVSYGRVTLSCSLGFLFKLERFISEETLPLPSPPHPSLPTFLNLLFRQQDVTDLPSL